MNEPTYKENAGIESFDNPDSYQRTNLVFDMREGLREATDFEPLSGVVHKERASYFWVKNRTGCRIRVKVEADIEE